MKQTAEEYWTPRTRLGKLVLEGKIPTINDVFMQGYRIQEAEIVDKLLPNLQQEVLDMGIVQKQTDAGEQARFKVLVAIGNSDGFIGVGSGKAKQIRAGIEKATMYAKLNLTPIVRGCGSWECGCGKSHSFPFKVTGKCGSVKIEFIPGPRGLGIVTNHLAATILRLAGIKDCWSKSYGATSTSSSLAFATYDALRNTHKVITSNSWSR